MKLPSLGILQGRLTPSPDGSIQFFPKYNWENEFGLAGDIGFDCIELLVKKDSCHENPLFRLNKLLAIRKLSSDLRISTPSIHGFYDRSEHYGRILAKMICLAPLVGARTVLVSFFHQNALNNEADKELARQQLSFALPYCQDADVFLGIETEMVASELREFVLSFNHPNIGVYYDIGNMASMGVNVASEIRELGGLICGVHVKDRLPNGGETVPLGEGCADFRGAFTALRDVGYAGPFIVQGARHPEVDDVSLNRRYFNFCKKLLDETYEERRAQ